MLAGIDEGLRDAEAGRTVPAEDVRKLLPQWITESSSLKKRAKAGSQSSGGSLSAPRKTERD
jgi:hypothetical protein